MSLITIDRSLFTSDVDPARNNDGTDAVENSSRSSQSEDFLMCKATAVGLNVRSRRRSSYIKPNDDIQDHLKKILGILRFGDYLQLAVRLQSDAPRPHHHRYCCIISTTGKQSTEESTVLGVDLTDRRATVGLVLPIWQDMSVKLFGDGGFELITKDTEKQFKPVSVQALWAAFQSLNRACHVARKNDYFSRGLTHDWVSYYHNLPASDTYQIQEWLKTDDIDGFNRYTLPSPLSADATEEEKERHRMESLIRVKLQAIMYSVDLEEVTVLQLRKRLEDEIGQPLRDYRHFIEEEVLTIYGRMDEASEIFDHLLLGTTFNASNRDELDRRSVTHILNVTREVDNFFPGDKFEYKNIRVFDDEQSSLLPYFEDTHRFINEAKAQGTCCLVHCKMGISRSATTVIAYAMKEQNWDLKTALAYVKCRRPCVQPNPGFMRELCTYQGILEASSNRHKPIFCKDASAPTIRTSSQTNPAVTEPCLEPTSSAVDVTPPSTDSDVIAPSEPFVSAAKPAADSCPSTDVLDLEAELFAFKPVDTAFAGACLLPDPIGPIATLLDCGQPDNTAGESTGPSAILHTDGPFVVWDLEVNAEQARSASNRSTLVARNSHCLRQWHPDLVEIVEFSDTTSTNATVCLPRGISASNVDNQLCHGEIQFILPYKSEELIDIPDLAPVPFRDATMSPPLTSVRSDPQLSLSSSTPSDQCCLVGVAGHAGLLALATITTPVLMHTSVQEQLITVEPSKGLASDTTEARQPVFSNGAPPNIFWLAPRLTDITPVQATLDCSCAPSETSVVTSAHVTPQLARQVPVDRRYTLPGSLHRSYIRTATLKPASPSKLRSSFPPSFSSHYPRRTEATASLVPPSNPTRSPGPEMPASSDPHSDQLTNWSDRRGSSFQVAAPSTATATDHRSMFRSVRLPASSRKPSPINRTQSARTAVTQRLRPDDSWIVCPTGANITASTVIGDPSTVQSATVQTVVSDSPGANAPARPFSSALLGPARNSPGEVTDAAPTQFINPLKCTSIVSGSATANTQYPLQPKPMHAVHSRKTLQITTSPRIAQVSTGPVQLSPRRPCSLFTLGLETAIKDDGGGRKISDVTNAAAIPSPVTSKSTVNTTTIKETESGPRDCSQTPSYLTPYRPGRRIVSWPPKAADPVATKS